MNRMILVRWRNAQFRQGRFVYPLMSAMEHQVVAATDLSLRRVMAILCQGFEFQATQAVHTYGKINTAVVHNCRQAIVSTLLRIRRAPSWSSIQAIGSAYRSVCNRHCLGSCCCECSGRTRPWIRRYRHARIRDALQLGRTRVRGGSFRRCQPFWRTGFESAWWAKRNVMRCGASTGSREAQVSYRAIY